jgi:hypothetical protein
VENQQTHAQPMQVFGKQKKHKELIGNSKQSYLSQGCRE